MPRLTHAELKKSENGYIKELVEQQFIQAGEGDPVDQLVKDANRHLLINGKNIPEEYHSKGEITGYIVKELGQEHGEALLRCYSQNPTYTLPSALGKAGLDCLAIEHYKYILSAEKSGTVKNIYIKDNKLCYEVKLKDLKFMNDESLAGYASCLSVYDKKKNAFVTQEIYASNSVIRDMLIDNKFDCKTAPIQAAQEDAAMNAAIKKATDFMNNLVTARDIIAPHMPIGYGMSSHPIVALDDKLSVVRFSIDQYLKESSDPQAIHKMLAEQRQACQQAIKEAASGINFILGKRLINTIANILHLKPPFEKVHNLDRLHSNIAKSTPLTAPILGR